MIELERTFLAKVLPDGLMNCKYKEIIDLYLPKEFDHPTIRIRKNGNQYEITKKTPIKKDDNSEMLEQTIEITKEEFDELIKLPGKMVSKIRYYYDYNDLTAEFDIFNNDLTGLVLIDFEFTNSDDKNKFIMPDFCLVDVTQEKFIAGGMLCGKGYKDIKEKLDKFNYKKLE